jgi:hypothetical protein
MGIELVWSGEPHGPLEQSEKDLTGANTLAYFAQPSVTKQNSFIPSAPEEHQRHRGNTLNKNFRD